MTTTPETRDSARGLTIDAPGTRCLDDAIWVDRTDDGGFLLTVSISDVTTHVKIGSLADSIAASRSAEAAGNGGKAQLFESSIIHKTASLIPRNPRPTISIRMKFNPQGAQTSMSAALTETCSLGAFSHQQFEQALAQKDSDFTAMFEAAVDLSRLLWARRVWKVGLPRWQAGFDRDGNIIADAPPGALATTVVHEMMVAANAAAARLVVTAGLPMIYRNTVLVDGARVGQLSTVCRGHHGLAKRVYGQFTSPLWRYVDLVNQRVLVAATTGRRAPYTLDELAEICHREAPPAQRQALTAVTSRPVARPVVIDDDPKTDRLDPFAFHEYLRSLTTYSREALTAISTRIETARLSHASVAFILFSKKAPKNNWLRLTLLRRLAASPGAAETVLMTAASAHGLGRLESQTVRTRHGWMSHVTIGRHSGNAAAGTPAAARHMAMVKTMASIVALSAPRRHGPGVRPMGFAELDAPEKLDDLCRLMKWQPPVFHFNESQTESGPERCFVVVSNGSERYRSPLVLASTRQGAQVLAARQAVRELADYAAGVLHATPCDPAAEKTVLKQDEGSLGSIRALKNFAARQGGEIKWTWLLEQPSRHAYHCLLAVVMPGQTIQAEGLGETHKAAMTAAAKKAISTTRTTILDREAKPGQTQPSHESQDDDSVLRAAFQN